ncbi:MAG: pilus assembly protein TadG-related protein, partial [Anaerolineales bacterium]
MDHLVILRPKSEENGSLPMRRTSEAGQSMVLFGLLLVVLIGMLALVMDGGYAFLQRRGAQTAADAGALAGARELCRSGDTSLATQVALDYAITRNRALEADVSIIDGEVEVTTRIPFPTFFGRVLGRTSMTSSAIAAAKCFPPGSATGILPIAWNCPPDKTYTDAYGNLNCRMQFDSGQKYIIMNSKKTGDDDTYCMPDGTVDCDIDNDGYDEL